MLISKQDAPVSLDKQKTAAMPCELYKWHTGRKSYHELRGRLEKSHNDGKFLTRPQSRESRTRQTSD